MRFYVTTCIKTVVWKKIFGALERTKLYNNYFCNKMVSYFNRPN